METPAERDDAEEQLRSYKDKAESDFKELKQQLNKQIAEKSKENTELRHFVEQQSQQQRIITEEKEDKIQTLEASNKLLDDRMQNLTAQVDELKALEVETSAAIKSKEDHAK
jgi:predicted nuclease with TOPRIM domain